MSALGLRALAVSRDLLERRVREAPGSANDAQVLAMLSGCRRGGSAVAGILDASGDPLGLKSDEIAWCAATVSYCLACAEPGEDRDAVPHGYRASVAEIVTDAKARGFWRGPSERPELGWLAVWTRAGQDPLRGGLGHVGRVSWVGDSTYSTVEGNHNDQVAEVAHTLVEADLRGWVVT